MNRKQEQEGVRSTESQLLTRHNDAKIQRGGGTDSSRRIDYIDALKGFGILCVVLGHVAQSYLDSGMFSEAETLLWAMWNGTYCFHMPFFFILSGFVYLRAYFDKANRLKSGRVWVQLLNLLGVYVLFSLIYGAFRIVFSSYANGETKPIDLLLIWARPIAEYWYLYTLIALYLIFMIQGIANEKSWILICVTFVLSLCGRYLGNMLPNIFCIRNILYYSLFFCIGVLLARNEAWLRYPSVTLSTSAVALILFIAFHGDVVSFSPIAKIMIAQGFSLGLWTLFERMPLLGKNRFFQYCGLHCLEIYVIHGFFTAGNRTILPLLGITNAYFSIALNFIISLTVPLLAARILETLGLKSLVFQPMGFVLMRRAGKDDTKHG